MKNENSLAKTNKHLTDPQKRLEIATRFSISSSNVEGIKPSRRLKKELAAIPRSSKKL
jgi:hypothetical protein